MKKLVFAFATIVALSFASCGNNTASENAVDSTAVDSIEAVDSAEVVDTLVADSVITAE